MTLTGLANLRWELFAYEGALLGLFMVSASSFAVVLFHPTSPVARRVVRPVARRAWMGVAMGLTAVALVYSPWGRASGAHMNPAVTLAFAALGKADAWTVAGYIAGQFVGGALGMATARMMWGAVLAHADVNYVVTRPGPRGPGVAALGELAIGFCQFFAVLLASNAMRTHAYTGVIAGGLVALWIVVEAPISGMSLNPARTLASALAAWDFRHAWVYLVVPPVAMLAAAGAYVALDRHVFCAKLMHDGGGVCPFRCEFGELRGNDVTDATHGHQTGADAR